MNFAAMSRSVRGSVAAGALLVAAAGTAQATVSTQDIFIVDGMIVDLLPESPSRIKIEPPALTVDAESRLGRITVRTMDIPPASAAEADMATRHLGRATAYLQSNDVTKALFEVRDGLTYNPNDPRLLSLAGLLSAQKKDFENSAHYFRRFLETTPGDLQHTAALVAVLLRLSRLDEADRYLRAGEAMNPEFLPLQFHRLCLRLIRDEKIAPSAFWPRRPIEDVRTLATWLASDRAELARMMGPEAFSQLCDVALGAGTVRTLDEISAKLAEAEAARRQGDGKAALEALRQVQARGVDGYGVQAALAESLESTGDVDGAVRGWAAIVQRFQDWPQPWLSYGHVLLRTGRFAEALGAAKRAKELSPNQPVVDFLMACSYAHQGSIAEAQKLFNELTLKRPREFRRWLESDPAFEAALDRMPNRTAILRNLEIPPEMEQ